MVLVPSGIKPSRNVFCFQHAGHHVLSWRNGPGLLTAELRSICMFRKQWHTFIRMRLKATCSPLLLLPLVGLQVSAATCAVRCGMESLDSPSQVSRIAHRSRMAFPSSPGQEQVAASTLSQPCDSDLCDTDWTFLQNQVAHDLSIASSSAIFASHAVTPVPIASRLQFEASRSTRSIPPFDPLISNLRV